MGPDRYECDHAGRLLEREREKEQGRGWAIKPWCYEADCYLETGGQDSDVKCPSVHEPKMFESVTASLKLSNLI